MPQVPKLYVSYGMPKSGSTLAFELTRTMLEMAGENQDKISSPAIHTDSPINFVKAFDKTTLTSLQQATATRSGPCVVKTHSKLFPVAAKELRAGQLFGQAVCRDPRDIALSMLDAAREGRAWGNGPNGPFRQVEETIPRIRTQINNFLAWASCENILALHYEQVAFDTEAAAARIAAQLGIVADLPKIIDRVVNERFTQKNRAIPQRWKIDMKPDDAAKLAVEFAEFIETHCSEVPPHPVILKPKKSRFSLPLLGKSRKNTTP
jgi:hypothetical protein